MAPIVAVGPHPQPTPFLLPLPLSSLHPLSSRITCWTVETVRPHAEQFGILLVIAHRLRGWLRGCVAAWRGGSNGNSLFLRTLPSALLLLLNLMQYSALRKWDGL